jgi:anti-sigma factor RsiW
MIDSMDRFRDWDSAYVLGMLSPDDRRAFERHLATCAACTSAVAELAGLPGILGMLTASEAVALDAVPDDGHLRAGVHEPDLVQRLAASAHRRQRGTRARVLGLLAAVALVFAVSGVLAGTLGAPSAPRAAPVPTHSAVAILQMSQVKPGVMTAGIQVSAKAWGTRFDWSCSYLDPGWSGGGAAYDLVITDTLGKQTIVASWTASGTRAAGLVASTGVPTADIRSVEIRASRTGTTLVRSEL